MEDIHNYKRRLEQTLKKIENSSISKENKKNLFDFHKTFLLICWAIYHFVYKQTSEQAIGF